MAHKIYAVVWVGKDYLPCCHITTDLETAKTIVRKLEICSVEMPGVAASVSLFSASVAFSTSSRPGVKWPWRWFQKSPTD